MRIQLVGVHTDLGKALQAKAEEKMAELAHYFNHITDVEVTFKQEGFGHVADVTAHANGLMLRAEGSGADYYIALEAAFTKLVTQLKKYKGRLTKHRERREKFQEHYSALTALPLEDSSVAEAGLEGVPHNVFDGFAPEIERKEVTNISPMSVDEAVMQMDLLHKPAFMFLNAKSGKLNMVYREAEGRIRWISPK